MIAEIRTALLACLTTFGLCAVTYPAVVYALGHSLFPGQAEGSFIERDGKIVGSRLIAQPFTSPQYFAPRPSAAGARGYAADAASGSNLAPTNPALRDRIKLATARQYALAWPETPLRGDLERYDSLQADLSARKKSQDPVAADHAAMTRLESDLAQVQALLDEHLAVEREHHPDLVTTDLVTASGSGLDPEISPESAQFQADRVARARQVPVDRIRALIDQRIDRSGAFLGAPARINVLLLNLDLDMALTNSAAKRSPVVAH